MLKYMFIFLLLLSFSFKNFAQDIQNILSKIPQADKEALKSIFYQIMHKDHGYYTLFGDKPISLSGDFTITPYKNILWTKGKYGGIFWKKWEIWEKYQNNFPLKNYLFIKEISLNCENVTNIIFINKKRFVKVVDKHLDIFRKKLSRNLTGQTLLTEIEKKGKFISIIKNDEVLWGILLGYGLHNAQLYNDRLKLEQFIYFEELPKIPIKKPLPQRDFTSIEEECDFLDSKLKLFGEHHYSPLIVHSVHFVADHSHPETKVLKRKYKNLRGKICTTYAKGNFLEITLTKLVLKN